MSRDLSAQVQSEIGSGAVRSVELVELWHNPTAALEQDRFVGFVNRRTPLVAIRQQKYGAGGVTYNAVSFKRESIKSTSSEELPATNLDLDGVDERFVEMVKTQRIEFRGKRVVFRRAFLDLDLNVETNLPRLYEAEINRTQLSELLFHVELASPLRSFARRVPGRTFQIGCPWVWGDDDCTIKRDAGNWSTTVNPTYAHTVSAWLGSNTIRIDNLSAVFAEKNLVNGCIQFPAAGNAQRRIHAFTYANGQATVQWIGDLAVTPAVNNTVYIMGSMNRLPPVMFGGGMGIEVAVYSQNATDLSEIVITDNDGFFPPIGIGCGGFPAGYFESGRIILSSGVNSGSSIDILEDTPVDPVNYQGFVSVNARRRLRLANKFSVAASVAGSTAHLYRNCLKTDTECVAKFDNLLSYGGYLSIPGQILKVGL